MDRSELDLIFTVTTPEEYAQRYLNTEEETAIARFKHSNYRIYEIIGQIISLEISIYTLRKLYICESNIAALSNLRFELIDTLREEYKHLYRNYNDRVDF